MGKIYW